MENEEKLNPTPANMQIEESKNALTIRYKWNKLIGYLALVFAFIWTTVLVFNFIGWGDDTPWFITVFMIPFILAGLFIFYFGLASIFNTTTITIDFDNVSIKHTPVFWIGNKDIYKHDIKQIYVKQQVHKGKNGTSYSYSVNAIDRANKDIKLVDSLQNADECKWIEQKMESFLKIQNKKVSGEYNG